MEAAGASVRLFEARVARGSLMGARMLLKEYLPAARDVARQASGRGRGSSRPAPPSGRPGPRPARGCRDPGTHARAHESISTGTHKHKHKHEHEHTKRPARGCRDGECGGAGRGGVGGDRRAARRCCRQAWRGIYYLRLMPCRCICYLLWSYVLL